MHRFKSVCSSFMSGLDLLASFNRIISFQNRSTIGKFLSCSASATECSVSQNVCGGLRINLGSLESDVVFIPQIRSNVTNLQLRKTFRFLKLMNFTSAV